MNFPYSQTKLCVFTFFCLSTRWTQSAKTGPSVALPWRDLYDTSPQFLLTQGRVISPVCWVHWRRRAEGWRGGWRWRARCQVHERRLKFCAASGQSCQRQTMQAEGAGAQLAHTVVYRLHESLELTINALTHHAYATHSWQTPDAILHTQYFAYTKCSYEGLNRTWKNRGCWKEAPKNALTMSSELLASSLRTVIICNPLVAKAFHGRGSRHMHTEECKNVAWSSDVTGQCAQCAFARASTCSSSHRKVFSFKLFKFL